MPQNLKKSKVSKTSKRHFTVVIKNKENGLYISSTPSLAAKKAVSKLCASNKNKKVEFHIREITRDSKKKTYGPYIGYLEQLNKSIKLKEYIIKYNTVVKLKKAEMRGGIGTIFVRKDKHIYGFQKYETNKIPFYCLPYFEISIIENLTNKKYKNFRPSNLVFNNKKYFNGNNADSVDSYLSDQNHRHTIIENDELNKISIFFNFREDITEDKLKKFLEDNLPNILEKLKYLGILGKVRIDLYYPYFPKDTKHVLINLKFKKLKYIEPEIVPIGTNQNILDRFTNIYKETNLRYLNMALQFIGINICLIFFANFLRIFDDNLPIISVGSGTAYFEFLITRIFRREIVCVDPDPKSYNPRITINNFSSNKRPNTVFITPEFKTVKDLLHANKSNKKYQNCLLLLNWPSPMFKETTPNYDPYDFNAIIKLKPIGFFIVYETTNCSGSEDLIKVLNGSSNSNIVNFKISEEEEIWYELLKDIKETEKKPEIGDTIYYRIAYYRRKKDISNLFNNNFF